MAEQKKQSRKASLGETIASTALGFSIAFLAQIIVFPWFGIHISLSSNFLIGVIFTVVSVARGFVVRRLFEELRVRGIFA